MFNFEIWRPIRFSMVHQCTISFLVFPNMNAHPKIWTWCTGWPSVLNDFTYRIKNSILTWRFLTLTIAILEPEVSMLRLVINLMMKFLMWTQPSFGSCTGPRTLSLWSITNAISICAVHVLTANKQANNDEYNLFGIFII